MISQDSVQWIYRQKGDVFGPMSYTEMIECIKRGDIADFAEVSEEQTQRFSSIATHPLFAEEIKQAILCQSMIQAHRSALKKKRVQQIKYISLAMLFVVFVFALSISLFDWLAGRQKKQVFEMALQEKKAQLLVKKIQAIQTKDIDDIDFDAMPALVSIAKKRTSLRASIDDLSDNHQDQTVEQMPTMPEEGTQGCSLPAQDIKQTLRTAYPALKQCIKEEQARQPSWQGVHIVLSFTVQNDGRVILFHSEDAQKGIFLECLQQTMTGLQFKQFSGERCNIDYPLSITMAPPAVP